MMKFEVEYQNPKGALLTKEVKADDQYVQKGVLQLVRHDNGPNAVFSVPTDRLVQVSSIEDDCCNCCCDDNSLDSDLPLTNSLDLDLDLDDDEYIQIKSTALSFNRTDGWSADSGSVEYKFTVRKEDEDA